MADLWERQSGEGVRPYEAFCTYRDMGPSRSTTKVAEKLSKSEQLIRRWSAAYDWVKRAAAWDDEQDRKARKAQLDEIVKMRKRHAQIAQTALEKVAAALETVNTETMSNSDIARLMDVSSKLERLSRGDTSEVVEERDGGEAINPVQIYIPSNGRNRGEESFDDLEV